MDIKRRKCHFDEIEDEEDIWKITLTDSKSEREIHEEMMKKRIKELTTKIEELPNVTGFNINSLPDELIVKIFQFLTQNELASIARVCKQWHGLSKCPMLWKKVRVLLSSSYESQSKVIALLCENLPNCTAHIELLFCRQLWTDNTLDFEPFCQRLGTQCSSLKTLALSHAFLSVNVQSVVDLCSQHLPNLDILSINCCVFSDYSVGEYGDHSKLKVLNISRSFGPYESQKLTLSKMSNLRKLILGYADVKDDWFKGDMSFMHHLEVVDLSFSFYIVHSVIIQALQTHASHLTELNLCKSRVADNDFSFRTSVFNRLKTLCLRSCHNVTCEGVVSLVRTFSSLQDVYVDRGVAKFYGVHPFTVANPSKLQIVKIGSGYHFTHEYVGLLSGGIT